MTTLRRTDRHWAPVVTARLREAGWNAVATQDGGIEARYPSHREHEYQAALKQCSEAAGYTLDSAPQTADELSRTYDELLRVADCMRTHGYPVSDPPDRTAYIEGVRNQSHIWHPYDQVMQAVPPASDLMRRVLNDCPVRRE